MKKKDINIGDIVYWNTTGAFERKISLKCKVVDIGKQWIWVQVFGFLACNNLLARNLTKEPLYKIKNNDLKEEL